MEEPPQSLPPLTPKKPHIGRVMLPPLEPRRLFTQRKKRVNIRYNPKNPKDTKRVSNVYGRLKNSREVRVEHYRNAEGQDHLVLNGNPNNIRNALGTNDPLTESPNENFMRSYRKSTVQPEYAIERPSMRSKMPSAKTKPTLRTTLLRKSFQNAKNLSQRFKHTSMLPKRLDFSHHMKNNSHTKDEPSRFD